MRSVLRVLALFLAVSILTLALAACGSKGDGADSGRSGAVSGESEDERPDINVDFDPLDEEPEFINPLTGLGATRDFTNERPVGIMLNNIHDALPQVGIGEADILFECLAEGGITRLFALFTEYDSLDVIGSVRSSRPYYLDFAQMFDAIYVHAGGSEDAYADIASRGINNIDGVRFDPLGIYYRDPVRMQSMAIEHTLMTTGNGIVDTIKYCGYRTELRDSFKYPFKFTKWGETFTPDGAAASEISLPFSTYQTVDYKYDKETKEYLRFQYGGEKHIDGATGDQLSFKNVIIIFCTEYVYDDYGRLFVDTVGDGDGYLATEGKYVPIKWHRDSKDGNVEFTDEKGNAITLNRGKTAINVFSSSDGYGVTFK